MEVTSPPESFPTQFNNKSSDQCDDFRLILNGQIGQQLFSVTQEVESISLVLSIIILILGIIGNVLVIVVTARMPRLKTPTNFLLANLALADLFVCIFCILPRHWDLRSKTGNAGLPEWGLLSEIIFCRLNNYFQQFSLVASSVFLMLVTLERWVAIRRFNYSKKQNQWIKISSGCGWLFSFAFSLPCVWWSRQRDYLGTVNTDLLLRYSKQLQETCNLSVKEISNGEKLIHLCEVDGDKHTYFQVYTVVSVFVFLAVSIAMSVLYGRIIRCLHISLRAALCSPGPSPLTSAGNSKACRGGPVAGPNGANLMPNHTGGNHGNPSKGSMGDEVGECSGTSQYKGSGGGYRSNDESRYGPSCRHSEHHHDNCSEVGSVSRFFCKRRRHSGSSGGGKRRRPQSFIFHSRQTNRNNCSHHKNGYNTCPASNSSGVPSSVAMNPTNSNNACCCVVCNQHHSGLVQPVGDVAYYPANHSACSGGKMPLHSRRFSNQQASSGVCCFSCLGYLGPTSAMNSSAVNSDERISELERQAYEEDRQNQFNCEADMQAHHYQLQMAFGGRGRGGYAQHYPGGYQGHFYRSRQMEVKDKVIRERKRVVRLLLVVASLFVLLTLPYQVVIVLQMFASSHFSWVHHNLDLHFCVFTLVTLQSALNPIIYVRLSKNFRISLRNCFRIRRRSRSTQLPLNPI